MRISDWSSDVCSSDLAAHRAPVRHRHVRSIRSTRPQETRPARSPRRSAGTDAGGATSSGFLRADAIAEPAYRLDHASAELRPQLVDMHFHGVGTDLLLPAIYCRSEEHTSELQSLMRISYAVFCL